ncbi:MAG: alpha-mannosidase [Pseudopedobacter saltans]|uniref:Alpha-mannosidase n=1 Tax=Pseudopedobacter saltans TaxID=151895 RepID=A0A2W5EZY4_9SPHI|nr:MAG: alpha-mannosidase [Pseudopedobacter saltans]
MLRCNCAVFFGLCIILFTLSGNANAQKHVDVLDYVHQEIGGVGHMLQPTRPMMQLPNEMVRMTPFRKDYVDDQITSFPLILVSYATDGLFSLMPNRDNIVTENSWNKKLMYDITGEKCFPWLYRTYFLEEGIQTEFVPGKKTGAYRFVFQGKKPKHLLFGAYNNNYSRYDFSKKGEINAIQTIRRDGYGPDIKVYMYGKFNALPIAGVWKTGSLARMDGAEEGTSLKIVSEFKKDTVLFQYAISYVSAQQAKENFELEFKKSDNFEYLLSKAKDSWRKVLGQIEVEGGTESELKSFYTALFRNYERMVNISENGKYFSAYDNRVHSDKQNFYVDDWIWDSYKAQHPLRTILAPDKEEDMIQSYVRMYEQYGWMPTFPMFWGDNACMNGFHGSIVVLDAYNKGLRGFDVESAYKGMRKNAFEVTMLPWRKGPSTVLDSFYYHHGYFPGLPPGEKEPYPFVHSFEKRQAVAVTLGASYDDWAVGQLASRLGHGEDAKILLERGLNYKNLWDAKKQFFMPKDSLGNWIDIDPSFDGGMGGRDYYDENNGWTYIWQVQQDMQGLVGLMGGEDAFEKRLDQLFRADLGRSKYDFWEMFPDATGLVGQFSMGNEPSLHIPYLYNYTKAPWKTQNRIRTLLKTWFDSGILGMPGDEDGGGLSAFVVFSSMGFYPISPGKPIYAIGSPIFKKMTIHLPNGKDFTVRADSCSEENKYIQAAYLNGKKLDTLFFTHKDLVNGGVLTLEMNAMPRQ